MHVLKFILKIKTIIIFREVIVHVYYSKNVRIPCIATHHSLRVNARQTFWNPCLQCMLAKPSLEASKLSVYALF